MDQWEWNLLEDKAQLEQIEIAGSVVKKGDRVRLNPRSGGDILDIALRGQIATIESLEEDYEGVRHVCVVLEEDPGRDLGMMRQPGHRFFFSPEEVQPIPQETPPTNSIAVMPRILVAGIGNIFMGDDAFGVEVARRLMERELPAEVRVVDFGIRGFDLAFALQDGYETTILVDAFPHGQLPGAVSIVEPDVNEISAAPDGMVEPHSLNPMNVLRMAKAMNGALSGAMSGSFKRILLVGCEPETLGGDEGQMGLSDAVEAAVDEAVAATESLVKRILSGDAI